LSRSARMASSTPGYWTLTATARPSVVMARWTWPIDADARGSGSHSAKTTSGAAPEVRLDHGCGQLRRHRGGVGLELGQGLAHLGVEAGVEVAGHLSELHEGALHGPERLDDLGRRLELAVRADLLAPLGRGEDLPGRGADVAGADACAHPGQVEAAVEAAGRAEGRSVRSAPTPESAAAHGCSGEGDAGGGGEQRDQPPAGAGRHRSSWRRTEAS
jgi:hypothetical protein